MAHFGVGRVVSIGTGASLRLPSPAGAWRVCRLPSAPWCAHQPFAQRRHRSAAAEAPAQSGPSGIASAEGFQGTAPDTPCPTAVPCGSTLPAGQPGVPFGVAAVASGEAVVGTEGVGVEQGARRGAPSASGPAPAWIAHLRVLVRKARASGAAPEGRLVACSVVLEGGGVVHGVNFALHRSLAPCQLRRRMLHGCAEHNAVAAVLAQGIDLDAVRQVAVYAECRERCIDKEPVPCLHCARILLAIATHLQEKGISLQLHLVSPSVSLAVGAVAPHACSDAASAALAHPAVEVHAWYLGV